MTVVYTLKLREGKYYVGLTNNVDRRINEHLSGKGSAWTKKYKFVSVISTVKGDAMDEEKRTLEMMEKYGVENVRGGSYTTLKISAHDEKKAKQTINSLFNKCYTCGQSGHYAKDCPQTKSKPIECDACQDTGTSYWSDGVYGACMDCDRGDDSDEEAAALRLLADEDDEEDETDDSDDEEAAALRLLADDALDETDEEAAYLKREALLKEQHELYMKNDYVPGTGFCEATDQIQEKFREAGLWDVWTKHLGHPNGLPKLSSK